MSYFDYGDEKKNTEVYGKEYSKKPPIYKDWKIDWCPITLITAEKDKNAGTEQAKMFAEKTNWYSHKMVAVVKEIKNYVHYTFIAPRHPEELFKLLEEG